ncbi:hypothetical protein JVT61DRAFT_10007 [Boletus reticuloceps]|uniref:G domain-containing protein n=1 Tax=Boletus reticuloceps TaxID=495285 RepID=A0A8I3ABS4_9AGAM|nr:hypothetical protein JVT61DRAFT_10007 [Boletus reticuloceps]
MGAIGTGKSTFIHLLTNDERIHIGHDPESETSDIQTACYVDGKTGLSVMLIDTPGFDDSREGVADTDILEKIACFLEPEKGERRKLNGIIYMHRISDPRVGGVSRKNLRMLHSLCGDDNLKNVRIVTTNWSRVGKQEGDAREEALRIGAFKALLDAGADMRRHLNVLDSAREIMSDLIPLKAITMQIQHELEAGMTLGDTSAGTVLTAEMREMREMHEKELTELKREVEEATKASNLALQAELAEERKILERRMELAEDDRAKSARILDQARKDLAAEQDKLRELREQANLRSAALRDAQNKIEEKRKQFADYMKVAEKKCRKLEREQDGVTRNNHRLVAQLAAERREQFEKTRSQFAALRDVQDKMKKERKRFLGQMNAAEEKGMKLERERQEAMRENDCLTDQLAAERRDMREQIQKQSAALRAVQGKIGEERKRLADRMRADETNRLKLEWEQREAMRRNKRLMEQLAEECQERLRQIKANGLASKGQAEEAYRKQTALEQRLASAERARKQLQQSADRGVFSGVLPRIK